MEGLLAADRGAEAGAIAVELASPERERTRPVRDPLRLATLKARAQLAVGGSDDLDALAKKAAASPGDPQARLDYANALASRGDYKRALDELLAIVDSDRAYSDEAARRAMLTISRRWGRIAILHAATGASSHR